ncbi:hypothetical protein K9L97_02600 [Candidatus Woesearchaeota archaeon]|nr:hypothetical protein [Candidatus Woesearchaeota archaeon]
MIWTLDELNDSIISFKNHVTRTKDKPDYFFIYANEFNASGLLYPQITYQTWISDKPKNSIPATILLTQYARELMLNEKSIVIVKEKELFDENESLIGVWKVNEKLLNETYITASISSKRNKEKLSIVEGNIFAYLNALQRITAQKESDLKKLTKKITEHHFSNNNYNKDFERKKIVTSKNNTSIKTNYKNVMFENFGKIIRQEYKKAT